MSKLYVDDVGTVILVNCGSAVTGATGISMKVKKPDGTEVSWTATVYGTDYITYTTIAGDLDQSGEYTLQASLTVGGWTGLGESASFTVYEEYE